MLWLKKKHHRVSPSRNTPSLFRITLLYLADQQWENCKTISCLILSLHFCYPHLLSLPMYRNLNMSACKGSVFERGCYRSLDAWRGKKGNGLSDLCEWFPQCSNSSMKARLVSEVRRKMSIATYPTSPRMESESGVWSHWTSMVGHYKVSNSSKSISSFCWILTLETCDLSVLFCKTMLWHGMSVYIQEICVNAQPRTRRELRSKFFQYMWKPLFVLFKEIFWFDMTGLFLRKSGRSPNWFLVHVVTR